MLSGIHVTLLLGPTVPVPVPQVVLDALTSIQVTTSAAPRTPSGFQLTFTLSQKSPLHTMFLLSAGNLAPFIRVILVVTMNGGPDVLMDGVVTRQSVQGGENGQVTLTVTGTDLTTLMGLVDGDGTPFPGMPHNVRVMTILAKYAAYGVLPTVLPPIFVDVPIPTNRIPRQQGTDLDYINQLAEAVGYVFYITPGPAPGVNTAYWGPDIRLGVPQPALNVGMDAFSNVESLSFSFNTDAATLPIVYIYNQETKLATPVPIPNINPLQPPLGLIPPLPQRINLLRDTARLSPSEALLEGLAEASRSSEAISANGSLDVLRYGQALKARGLVGVRGAGMAFDGLYYVQSVTHNIKRGEYKQSFTLTRNGLVSITPVVPP